MTSYAVFFADDAAIGMELIEATDVAAAEVIALELHLDTRLTAMNGTHQGAEPNMVAGTNN